MAADFFVIAPFLEIQEEAKMKMKNLSLLDLLDGWEETEADVPDDSGSIQDVRCWILDEP